MLRNYIKNTILLLLSLLLFCSSPQGRTAKVIESEGLILRDKPTMQGRQLALMKEKEEVLVQSDDGPEETLYGRKSRWFEVKYRGIQGYAFGGFLEFTGKQNSVSNKTDFPKELPKTITNSIGMEFMLIPAGEFLMGCSDGDTLCYDDEKPQHKVRITKPLYMSKYEVTQGQWKKVIGSNPSRFKDCGADCPVESVSWKDAQQFIQKLNDTSFRDRSAGQKGTYRLPAEAEWEYAARAGTNTIWYGNLDEIAWYNENSGITTHSVGKKRPNAFGLYDMLGNVWEWTADRYDPSYYQDSPKQDTEGLGLFAIYRVLPRGSQKSSTGVTGAPPRDGGYPGLFSSYRVLRGGSWSTYASGIRVSLRDGDYADYRFCNCGFRLVYLPQD